MTKSSKSFDSPEYQHLLALLDKLKSIRNLLLFEIDLRTVDFNFINTLEGDLRAISKEVERLRVNPNTKIMFKSADAFETEIMKAREELYTASYTLERANKISNIRLFYQSLNNCERHIAQALQQVVDIA